MNKVNAIIIGIIIIGLTGLYFIWNNMFSQEGSTVVVQKNNAVIARYSLQDDLQISITADGKCVVSGDEGTNMLRIENGTAYIEYADCPDKICVKSKPVSNIGEAIVCLPNSVIVSVE